jgi:hypothetical protein
MDKMVVIGIPIYKNSLNEFEKISLQQVKKILGGYSIMFIAPESLQFDYGEEYRGFKIERFSDSYFQSTASYSQLLLSIEFYQRFCDYEFLLIYQLDAFVFSDQLETFCKMNFDYIGAPTYWPVTMEGLFFEKKMIGNGGFSLRKIKSAIRILEKKRDIHWDAFLETEFNKAEDVFFAFCGSKKEFGFKVPSTRVASQFSVELYFKRHSLKLPFGCHAWYKLHFDNWRSSIEKYGFSLNALQGENLGQRIVRKYLSKRIIRAGKVKRLQLAIGNYINGKEEYRIWGAGEDGRRCLGILRRADIPVECIYDSKAQENQILSGIAVKRPLDSEIQDKHSLIIIATKKYEQEIMDKLERFKLRKGKSFLLFDELEENIVESYYSGIRPK